MPGVSGKYRLEQRLGGGGMAEVFLASAVGAEGFSRKVAIKRVLPGFSDNEAFAKMFVDEAQLSSRLVHPNIVSVLDFDRDPEHRLFLVMELVEGKDLDALVATGLLPIPVVIYVIAEVLRGLGYAHDLPGDAHVRGLVHRDVSPHNVLLSWEGAVKVSDFGIAKARAASEATASVFIKGKPAYMSPEQANGQALDGRSDLFAVGIMLWEMIVGRRLFVGNDTRATLAAVLFGQIPRPRALRGDLPKDLERVTMKLLERDLPARYATAEDAIAELLECADAPKAGRELLTATLAERFAGEAPIRHSQQRARSLPPGHRATPAPGMTLPDGSAAPMAPMTPMVMTPPVVSAHTMPSLGSVRNAPTGTLDHGAPPPRSRKILLAAAAVGIGALASFAVVSAVSGRDAPGGGGSGAPLAQTTAGADAGMTTAGADAGMTTAGADAGMTTAGADAAVPPRPLPPPPPVDAAVPDAPADASARPRDPPSTRPARKGKLHVPGYPALAVLWRGKKIGESPCTVALPVGAHTITLKSQGADVIYPARSFQVRIRENETTTVKR